MPNPKKGRTQEGRAIAEADDFKRLRERYLDRLADIAELGHVIARKDKELAILERQHEDRVSRNYVVSQLRQSHTRMQQLLAQKHRIFARWRLKKRLAKEIDIVAMSGLFDAKWYRASNPDIAESGVDPLRHFVMNGAYELRDPGPQFSSLRYHKAYPDVTAGGSPALMHFLRNGMAEGRTAFRVIEDD